MHRSSRRLAACLVSAAFVGVLAASLAGCKSEGEKSTSMTSSDSAVYATDTAASAKTASGCGASCTDGSSAKKSGGCCGACKDKAAKPADSMN